MPRISRGRVFLLAFFVIMLLAIPVTVFMVSQRLSSTTKAEKSTTLSFSPVSKSAAAGEKVSFDIYVSPGSNLVNFVKLALQYDPLLLSTQEDSFTIDPNSNLKLVEGPTPSSGSLSLTLSTSDPTQAINTDSKLGTVTFDVLEASSSSTQISFDSNLIQIRSVGSTDAITENVFLSGTPATLTISSGESSDSGSLTNTENDSPQILTPSSNEKVSDQTPSFEGTAQPNETVNITINSSNPINAQVTTDADGNWTYTPTTTLAPGSHTITISSKDSNGVLQTIAQNFVVLADAGSGLNEPPICDSLEADNSLTGEVPYILGFTANGSDQDGTVDKVTFNFGDGGVLDITQGGGVGTATVSATASHTYQDPGTFSANAILTDDGGAVSDTTSCNLSVTITGSGSATLSPIPATGPSPAIVGIGVLGGVLLLIGSLLFFVL